MIMEGMSALLESLPTISVRLKREEKKVIFGVEFWEK
jgi:hypothetical protein